MSRFESLAERATIERWWRFVADLPLPRRPRSNPDDGFLRLAEAAVVMGVDTGELVAMVGRGELEHRDDAERGVLVRPAIVSKLAVRTGARVMS